MDCSPPGSSIHGIFQARVLEWGAVAFSRPSYVVGTNYRVLIYCTCHFQGGSLCFSFFCLLVSSVSNFCPDTTGWWWTLFWAYLFSRTVGREGCCKQHWHVFAVSRPHWVCPCSWHVCFPCQHCLGSRLFCREQSEAGPGLHAPPRSKPLRFRHSGSLQRCNSIGPAFCAFPRSEQLR